MITDELLSYINKQIADGITKDQISESLLGAGWTASDIDEAFRGISTNEVHQPITPQQSEGEISTVGQTNISENKIHQNITNPEMSSQTSQSAFSQEDTNLNISQNSIESHKLKKIWIIIVVVVLVILIGAGSVYAYFSFAKRLTPYEVITKMIKMPSNTNKFESVVVVNLQANSKGSEMGKVDIELTVKGNKDISDIKNLKADTNINAKVDIVGGFFGINLVVNVDMKILDSILYVRLNKISKLPIPLNFDNIIGKWIKIDSTEVKNIGGPISGGGQYVNNILKKNIDNQKKMTANIVDFLEGIEQIVNRSVSDGQDKKINNVNVYDYVVKVSSKDMETLFDKFVKIANKPASSGDVNLAKIAEFKKSKEFKHMIDILSKVDFQMWIGKKDFLPYKIVIKSNLVNEKFIDQSRRKANHIMVLSSLSLINIESELFRIDNSNRYGDDFKLGTCPVSGYAGTIFIKDKSISSSIKEIRDAGAKNITCVAVGDSASASKYAISAVFADDSGGWCVDSSQFSGSGTANKDGECGKYIPTTETVTPNDFITINGVVSYIYSASDYGKSVVVESPKSVILIKDVEGLLKGNDAKQTPKVNHTLPANFNFSATGSF